MTKATREVWDRHPLTLKIVLPLEETDFAQFTEITSAQGVKYVFCHMDDDSQEDGFVMIFDRADNYDHERQKPPGV